MSTWSCHCSNPFGTRQFTDNFTISIRVRPNTNTSRFDDLLGRNNANIRRIPIVWPQDNILWRFKILDKLNVRFYDLVLFEHNKLDQFPYTIFVSDKIYFITKYSYWTQIILSITIKLCNIYHIKLNTIFNIFYRIRVGIFSDILKSIFSTSRRGGRVITYNGNRYNEYSKAKKGPRSRFVCTKWALGCRGQILLFNNEIIRINDIHNHWNYCEYYYTNAFYRR